MPKIDESKIADILNSLLTENIKTGESLISKMDKSVGNLTIVVKALDGSVATRTSEIQELVKAINNAPKVSKAIKYQTIFICVLTGIIISALFFSYSTSVITYNYVKTHNTYQELTQKYDELENYAILLKNKNEALERTLGLTLTPNGREKFNELFSEELQKIEKEQH